jgi:hypothetical protein
MDRGYCDFSLLRSICDDGHDFLVRLKSNLAIVKEFKRSGLNQMILSYRPPAKVRREAALNSSLLQSFPIRLIRYRIKGTEYFLATTLLDTKKVPGRDLMDLYHQRWQIEESYKVKKCRLDIEAASGMTPETLLQDFHAKVFAESLTTALTLELRDEVEAYCLTTRDEYKISLSQAASKMKDVLVLLFFRSKPMLLLIDLAEIFFKSLVAASPGRSYPRKRTQKFKPRSSKPALSSCDARHSFSSMSQC